MLRLTDLVSANYTNGLNIALGRLVTVNFNNQNGLKQNW